MTGAGARVIAVMPDGQELRASLYERRQTSAGWEYRVGITVWGTGNGGRPEPVEHRVWLGADHVRPLESGDYSRVPTRPAGTPAAFAAGRQAWTVQQLPHRPGHPGATLIHVIGCQPGGIPLDLDQTLDALKQPRAVTCRECNAASSLP
ncbi:hypothetical protein OG985_49650 (plasmid) [Streptomyces sp. NBC_00289]|uniref:DUF6233 domain-containing protein n=1 Tax=Streptomyces sp. NBC_00289 TaxID=2975703 RepID=UPI002F912C3D